jgi:beta-N-acetylhexosaminidase
LRSSAFWVKVGGPVLAAIAAVAAIALASSAAAGPVGSSHPAQAAGSSAARSSRHGASPWPAARVRSAAAVKLSLRQQAGQRVIYSYSGLTPPASLLSLIRHGDAAGVIFFGDNISSKAQIRAVINELDAADASPDNPVRAPLLLMTDQEGGEVRRLPGQPYLSEKQIGESAHPAAEARKAGRGAGRNLAGVGMDVNLAPVLDVYRKAGDFDDQYGRSYSMNPDVVSELGADFITAQQATGVAATAKHFPGLGAARRDQDTDVRPVTLHVSLHALHTIDEYPYQAAIAAGVKLVMVSWAIYPALQKGVPAGFSSTIVQGQLRDRLGFQGVTITDALEAGAVQAYGTFGNRARLAAGAGMDLILCSDGDVSEGDGAANGLAAGYRDGVLSHAAFRQSVDLVIALRESLSS